MDCSLVVMLLEGTDHELIQRLCWWLYSSSPMKFFLEGLVMSHISLMVQDENGICTQAEFYGLLLSYKQGCS